MHKLWSLIAGCLLVLSLCLPAAANQETEVIRLPYGYNDFLTLNEEGSPAGLLAEYFARMAAINGWTYEYVKTDWPGAVEKLQTGEIDILYPASQWMSGMETAQVPMGYVAPGLFSLQDSQLAYNDYEHFNGARIAIYRDSHYEDQLKKLAQNHGFSYEPVYFDSVAEVKQALKDGSCQLAVLNAYESFPEGKVVALLEAEPAYLAVKAGNEALLASIDQSMEEILKSEHELASSVLSRLLMGSHTYQSAFTTEEKALVEAGRPIRIGFYEDTEPLAWLDENGQPAGIYIQLLEKVAANSGLNLELVPLSRNVQWKDLLQDGTLDFYVGSSTAIVKEDPDLESTIPLLSYANVLVTTSHSSFPQLERPTIALTSGRSYWVSYLADFLPMDFDVLYFATARECMEAVAAGKADATLINNMEFNYHSKNARMASMIQWNEYRFQTQVSLTGAKGVDPVVLSALNKALPTVGEEEVQTIIYDTLNLPYHSYTAADILYNARVPLAAAGTMLLGAVILWSLVRSYQARQNRLRLEQQKAEKTQLQTLAALSRDFEAVVDVDLDQDTARLLQSSLPIPHFPSYSADLQAFVDRFVVPEDRPRLLVFTDPQAVKAQFAKTPEFYVRFRVDSQQKGAENYELVFIDVSHQSGSGKMVLGIRHIDQLMQEEKERQQLLQEALDGANRANEAKSDFFSRMSHDIRTPLNAISGLTALAASHVTEPERVQDSLTKISGASQHLLSLVNDVLDMSKIETGKLSLQEEETDLLSVVQETVQEVRPQMEAHGHQFQLQETNIRHPQVYGDGERLKQILHNLLDNAAKYTPDGGIITLAVSEIPGQSPQSSGYVFSVTDNGIGMDEAFVQHMFEPFSREEDLRTSKVQGSGLGLAITQHIVQMMNGTIQVETAPGKGSTFTVTVNLRHQPDEKPETLFTTDNPPDFVGKHVLLAEDNELNREIAEEVLAMTGIQVTTAVNGQEAVDKFLADPQKYDLILMDVQMPVMNGYEAARQIRKMDGNIPIVAMTANAYAEDIQASREAGMDDHVAKPVQFARLYEVLKKRLG